MNDRHPPQERAPTCPSAPTCHGVAAEASVGSVFSGRVHLGARLDVGARSEGVSPGLIEGLFLSGPGGPKPAPPEPAPPEGLTRCHRCDSAELIDDPAGIRCDGCGHLVFIEADGELRSVRWHDHDDGGIGPDDLPNCPTCNRLADTQTADDVWHCSRCDPDAGRRRILAARLLATAERIRATGNPD